MIHYYWKEVLLLLVCLVGGAFFGQRAKSSWKPASSALPSPFPPLPMALARSSLAPAPNETKMNINLVPNEAIPGDKNKSETNFSPLEADTGWKNLWNSVPKEAQDILLFAFVPNPGPLLQIGKPQNISLNLVEGVYSPKACAWICIRTPKCDLFLFYAATAECEILSSIISAPTGKTMSAELKPSAPDGWLYQLIPSNPQGSQENQAIDDVILPVLPNPIDRPKPPTRVYLRNDTIPADQLQTKIKKEFYHFSALIPGGDEMESVSMVGSFVTADQCAELCMRLGRKMCQAAALNSLMEGSFFKCSIVYRQTWQYHHNGKATLFAWLPDAEQINEATNLLTQEVRQLVQRTGKPSMETLVKLADRYAPCCAQQSQDLAHLLVRLALGVPFGYAHINDGEIIAATSRGGMTDRGWQYTSKRLEQKVQGVILVNREGLFIGGPCPSNMPVSFADWQNLVNLGGPSTYTKTRLTIVDMFINGNYAVARPLLPQIWKARETKIHLVANPMANIRKLEKALDMKFSAITYIREKNAFPDSYYEIRDAYKNHSVGEVILLCAGPLGRILAIEWFDKNPLSTYIDLGSFFDLELFQRNLYHTLEKGKLKLGCKHPGDEYAVVNDTALIEIATLLAH